MNQVSSGCTIWKTQYNDAEMWWGIICNVWEIKVKLPSAKIELAEAQKVYQKYEIPISMLAERVHHVIQSSFDGRRIVIFSGGAATEDEKFFEEVRAIRDGGGFGSIVGRNSFQRKKPDALKFLGTIMGIYEGSIQ